MTSRWIRAAQWFYRHALVLYPRDFRMVHASPMTQLFGDQCRRVMHRDGVFGLLGLWGKTSADVIVNACAERLDERRRKRSGERGPCGTRVRRSGSQVVSDFLGDVAYTVRSARRSPAMALASLLTLAVGLGANISVFSVVYGVLLEPLPLPAPDQLVSVQRLRSNGGIGQLSYPDVVRMRTEVDGFSGVAGYSVSLADVVDGQQPGRLDVATVTAGYFDLVGAIPFKGRLLQATDEGRGKPGVTVLTHTTWERQFGLDSTALGRDILLDDRAYTVVGVLPPGFTPFPDRSIALFIPQTRENFGPGAFWLAGVARLRNETSLPEARTQLAVLDQRLLAEHPDLYSGRRLFARGLREALVEDVRPMLGVLFAAVILVLFVAAANVANMQAVRTVARHKEFAMRVALGASRGRLMRQLLAEGIALAVAAGVLAFLVSRWTTSAVLVISPETLPRRADVDVDVAVALFAAVLSLVVGIAVAAIAGMRMPQTAPREAFRPATPIGIRARSWHLLSAGQVALSMVLVVAAGLLLKSFRTLSRVDPGFRTENLVSFRVSLLRSQFPDQAGVSTFHSELRDRLAALPGIDGVASVSLNPFNGGNICSSVVIESRADVELTCAEFRTATPGYFELMGIPLRRGRDIDGDARVGDRPVAVVNETFARQAWGDDDPVGERFTIFPEFPNTEVIGVVSDVRQFGLDRDVVPEIYMSQQQFPHFPYARYVVRTSGDPDQMIAPLRAVAWALRPGLPISETTTMQELIDRSVAAPRFRTWLLSAMAFLALVVSSGGVIGVLAFAVNARRREIGVRLALGAAPRRVVGQVMRTGGVLLTVGIGVGSLIALFGARLLQGFLFGVEPRDVSVYLIGAAVVFGIGMMSCYVPARRASSVDPLVALRGE